MGFELCPIHQSKQHFHEHCLLLQASSFNALGKNKSGKGTTGPRRKNRKKYEDDEEDSEDDVVRQPASKPAVLDLRRSVIPPAPRVGGGAA